MRRIALLFLLAGCSGGDGAPTEPDNQAPVAAQVSVTAQSDTMSVGATQQLSAAVMDPDGNVLTNRTVTWASSDTLVVTVSSSGLATAVGAGTARVTASSELAQGTADLTIRAADLFTPLGTILTTSTFGVEAGLPVADATAIQLADGRVRLYVFAQGQGTRSAISTDATGTAFTAEPGVRSTNDAWGQPRIIRLPDGRLRLYYTAGDGVRSGISTDGLVFTDEPGLRLSAAELGYEPGAMSIVPRTGGGYRAYFSDLEKPGAPPGGHYIRSAVSDDLLNWTVEPGIVLGVGATQGVQETVSHPFAVANADGSVTLYYQGERATPGSVPPVSYRGIYRATSADGRTFSSEEKTGIVNGADPDVITLANGTVMMYYGDFNSTIGGHILVARLNR